LLTATGNGRQGAAESDTEPTARCCKTVHQCSCVPVQPEPKLTDAAISFFTWNGKGLNKNENTQLTVTVRQLDGTVAARIANYFGEFKEGSNNGPFNLLIINQSARSQLRSGNVTLRIDPDDVSGDEWKFNFFLSLGFSDSSHLSASADGVKLTENSREQSFGVA